MTIADLYPYLILVGFSILSATGWLLYQSRIQAVRIQELSELNEVLNYDLPDFLRQCWPSLRAGGFSGITWTLDWFGTSVSGMDGDTKGRVIQKRFEVQEISLVICLYLRQGSWEQRYFNSTLADSLFLLVRMNLWIKLGTVQGAFEQAAKMTVFLQHDVKNMVQLINLTAEQLDHPVIGQEQKLIDNLKAVIPAIRDRAQHMLDALVDLPANNKDSFQQLEVMLKQTCQLYALPTKITGHAIVNIQKDILQSIIDNLLGNFSRQSKKDNQQVPELIINLKNKDNFVLVSIRDNNGEPCQWPERLFEPFWSEHGEGRGIGLYQSRQQVSALGGSLSVEALPDEPLLFNLSLPLSL